MKDLVTYPNIISSKFYWDSFYVYIYLLVIKIILIIEFTYQSEFSVGGHWF